MRPRRISDATRREIARRYTDGEKVAVIAADFELSDSRTCEIALEEGCTSRRQFRKRSYVANQERT